MTYIVMAWDSWEDGCHGIINKDTVNMEVNSSLLRISSHLVNAHIGANSFQTGYGTDMKKDKTNKGCSIVKPYYTNPYIM